MMTFRLRADADPVAFIAADADVQAHFSYQQPGILRRTIARSDAHTWLILTHWHSDEAADVAAVRFDADPYGMRLRELIDTDTIEIQRYRPAGAA